MNNKLQFLKNKLGYSVGAVGLDLSYGMFYSFLSVYLTDVLGLHPAFLLIVTALARIWDGINDPMMGTIVDNTNTRMGKYRPWILRGTISNAVVLFLLFTNFLQLGGVKLYVYAAVMYVLWGMTNTMADIPFWSMIPSFTNEPRERSLISTMTRVFSGIGQGIVTIATPLVLVAFSKTYSPDDSGNKVYDANGFMWWTLFCAVCLIIFGLICVKSTSEKHVVKAPEKFSLKKAIGIVRSNDQLLVFMLFAMLSNAGWYLTSSLSAYYFGNVIGDASKQTAFGLFGGIGSAVGIVVLPILTKFTSKRRTYQISLAACICGYIAMFASAAAGSLMLMNICYVVTSVGMATMFVAQTIFLADVVDYGEIKMGFRAESITFSMKGFLQKLAYTLQTVIMYSGLWGSGYSGELKTANTASVKSTITVMMLLVPVLLFIASLIVFTFKFKLHGEFMDSVTKKIDERRTGKTD